MSVGCPPELGRVDPMSVRSPSDVRRMPPRVLRSQSDVRRMPLRAWRSQSDVRRMPQRACRSRSDVRVGVDLNLLALLHHVVLGNAMTMTMISLQGLLRKVAMMRVMMTMPTTLPTLFSTRISILLLNSRVIQSHRPSQHHRRNYLRRFTNAPLILDLESAWLRKCTLLQIWLSLTAPVQNSPQQSDSSLRQLVQFVSAHVPYHLSMHFRAQRLKGLIELVRQMPYS